MNKLGRFFWDSVTKYLAVATSWKVAPFFCVTIFLDPWHISRWAYALIVLKAVLDTRRTDALVTKILLKSAFTGRLIGLPIWGAFLLASR